MPTHHILVVTGASGAGKTAAVRALEACAIERLRCFYFDSIGVPSAEVMDRDFGGGEQWQALATARTERLCGPRGQPELARNRMMAWAAYLRGQADALKLPVIDTTDLPIAQVAERLEVLARSLG